MNPGAIDFLTIIWTKKIALYATSTQVGKFNAIYKNPIEFIQITEYQIRLCIVPFSFENGKNLISSIV